MLCSRSKLLKLLSLVVVGCCVAQTTVVAQETVSLNDAVTNEGSAIKGGTLRYALVGAAFKGVLSSMYSEDSIDASIIGMFNPGLYGYDDNFYINDSGLAKVTFDKENKKVTIKIPDNVKWDDGEPLTIEDVIYPYYVIGHADYTGVRYGEDLKNIVGMEDYHAGKTDTISGLNKVDDYTLEVTYKEFNQSLYIAGGGVQSYVEPSHIVKSTPIKDLQDSEYVRSKPVGFGPFKFSSMVSGESIQFVANDTYYKGKPKLDGVNMEVVSAQTAVAEMRAGSYDIAQLPSDEHSAYKDATNFKTIGKVATVYDYIGFKMGKWDNEKSEVVTDESRVTANVALRQAMAYALDNKAVGEKFYGGLRFEANSLVPPVFKDVYDSTLSAYSYNPDKAKQILADAGFVDKDGDGFVEDPNGKQFKINFAARSGNSIAEPLAQYYIDSWRNVGINVDLQDGRLLEFNAFYDLIESDDANVDVYAAGWDTGGDPNPSNLYGRNAKFNYGRWATKENDDLIAKMLSPQSLEATFRQQVFKDWQVYMSEQVPVIPTLYRYELTSVNNRVKNFSVKTGDYSWETVELLADSPVKE